MFSAPFLATLLDRVKAVVRRVARPVVQRIRPVPAIVVPDDLISPDVRGLMHTWLSAKLNALSAVMRRIEAGEMPRAPVRAPRTGNTRAADERDIGSPEDRLPRGFGWMCAFGPDIREDGAAFAAWLREPAMQAMVQAAPEHMAKVISPILAAVGQRRPDWIPVAPKRARARHRATDLCAVSVEGLDVAPGAVESRDGVGADGEQRRAGGVRCQSVALRVLADPERSVVFSQRRAPLVRLRTHPACQKRILFKNGGLGIWRCAPYSLRYVNELTIWFRENKSVPTIYTRGRRERLEIVSSAGTDHGDGGRDGLIRHLQTRDLQRRMTLRLSALRCCAEFDGFCLNLDGFENPNAARRLIT
jgi:hypothetical protein